MLLGDAETFVDACRAARAAQREWAPVPAPVRGRVIAQVGRLVEANKEALARLVTREIGKPYAESLGEVQEIIDTCDFFLGEGRRLYGQTVPSEMPDKQLFTFRVPVGVAAIITAGNFPVAVPSWYLVPALLCGNAVVWKPAEYSRRARRRAGRAVPRRRRARRRAQPRPGRRARRRSRASSARSTRASSTRSASPARARSARKIGELCGRHLQSPCLELGGKNPMVVMDDADLDLAVEGALFGGFGTAGQRCTSLGTAIVHESVHDEFVERLDERAARGADRRPDAGRALRADAPRALRRALRGLARPDPATTTRCYGSTATGPDHAPTTRATASSATRTAGLFYHPTIVDGVTPRRRALRAPRRSARSSAWRSSRRFDEAIELANGHGYGLSSAIYTRSGAARPALPRADHRRHGLGQQLDLRRRGAPAVRRQRQVRQRLAPVGHLGARPVHPLAVDELGLRRQAAEGPDGRGRDRAATRSSGSPIPIR